MSKPEKCPRCGSPEAKLHPAVQFEGEVQPCPHPWHQERLTLDTDREVYFYEQDHYYLSNFSAFRIGWKHLDFDTAEHLYHWLKFMPNEVGIARKIREARSAHEAFKLAEHYKSVRRPDWPDVRIDVMRDILRAKVDQHEYVRRKLLETGNRILIENSWRDDYWGWGPNRNGQNKLGKLWMEVREELRK